MARKIVAASTSLALYFVPATASAQEYRFRGFDAPPGAAVTANIRVPLGPEASPSYGLTLAYGQTVGAEGQGGWTRTRRVELGDLRFDSRGRVARAEIASFNLADLKSDPRLRLSDDGSPSTLLLIGGGIAVGVLVLLLIAGGNDTCEPENCLF